MLVPLDHVKDIARHVLAGHEPGFVITRRIALAAFHATDLQAFALSQGVESEAVVFAQYALVVEATNLAFLRRQIAHQEFLERTLADKADASRILFHRHVQPGGFGHAANFGFGQSGERKQGFCQLPLIQPMQEIALILVAVGGLEQLETAIAFAHAGVMAGSDAFGPHLQRMIEKGLELDLRIAQHVGIRGASGTVLFQKDREHALAVLFGKIHHLDIDADGVGDAHHVDQILARGTVFVVVIIFPVFHEEADHLPALLLEQQGGHRGIHTAGEAHHHGSLTHRHAHPSSSSSFPAT